MANIPGGSLVDGAAGSDPTSGGSSGDASNAPHLRSLHLSGLPTMKRSSRNASNPYRAHPPTTIARLGTEAMGSYERKRKQPTEEASHGISEAVKAGDSAPLTLRDPNRTYGSKDGAKGRLSEHGMIGNARSSPKKRKCMPKSNYLSLFKPHSKWQATAVIARPEQSSIPTKTNKVKESPFQKLQKLPDGCHPDFDNDHLCSVNNLREFRHKSQGLSVFVDVAVAADPDHVESPNLASPQNHMTLEYPPAEAEPTDKLLVMATQDLQTGTQTSSLTLDAQHQRMCPDDSSKMNLELDTAAEVILKGTTSNHLGDSSAVVKDKNADTVADPLNSENHSYIAPHVPAVLPDASEVETQTDQSNMPAQHSTGLPAQQNTAITGHPQAEAEPSSNLDTDSAQSLQPDIQSSSSILDADSSQTRRQLETAPVLSQGASTYHHLVDGRMGFDVNNNGMVCAHQAHSESPTFAAPQSPETLPFSLDVGTCANLSGTDPLQSSEAPSSPPPAVAESPGMLGTQLEQDLCPNMAPSISLSGVQTGCRPDRATDLSEAGETEYLTCATCNLATLPASREAETENDQASVPAQKIGSPHAQHNLATSQPLVDDLQPPTLILSEEAEGSSMLCAAAAQDLQHGMQPSITTHDVRLEINDLSGMPVTLSTTVLQSVEPSMDPHAEQADTLGILSDRDLQPEVQPSSPMQDQPAEVEGAGTSGTIAVQNLQPETQSSTSVQHNPPERTHPDERIQVGLQPSSTSGPAPFTQLITVLPAAVNTLSHSSEPLIDRLEKLKLWKIGLSKDHEQKKSKLQAECNQEMEKIKRKFELMLQKEDQDYHQSKKCIYDVYMKVSLQQSLAENFAKSFKKLVPAQERSVRPTIRQAPQSFQQAPTRMSVAETTSLPVASPLATRPPGLNSLYSTGPFLQPSQVPQASASEVVQPQPALPGSLYRATPSPVSSMVLRYGSYGRAPAPHLRMPAASAVARGDRQQLAAMSPGITSSRQSAPGMLEGFASVSALAGIPSTSMASSSVQQAMRSASNSLPSLPTSSPLPGSASELMPHFLQSPSTIPVAIAGQQASGLIPGFRHVPGGSLNGTAGIAQAGGHLGVTNQAAPEPTREVLLLLQRQWLHALAPTSSVRQPLASASNPHPGLLASSANRYLMGAQQAFILNPASCNVAGPANAAAGVWHRGAAPAVAASQPDAPGPSSSNRTRGRAASRTGLQASGASCMAPQGG